MSLDLTKSRHISRFQNRWIPITANHTVTHSESLIINTASNITVTLPSNPGTGAWCEIWLKEANRVTVNGNGKQISGLQVLNSATYVHNHSNSMLTLIYDGTQWQAQSTADTGAQRYDNQTGNFNAFPGESYRVDVSGGSLTVTLPASPRIPDIYLQHIGGDLDANPVTIARSGGNTILGESDNLLWDTYNGSLLRLHWTGSTWQVTV